MSKGAERGVPRRRSEGESDSFGENGARLGVPSPRRALKSSSRVYFLQVAKKLVLFGQGLSHLWCLAQGGSHLGLNFVDRNRGGNSV